LSTKARQSSILQALQAGSRVRAGELAARFGVSEDTIRRDLRSLADHGLIRRVYGGAVPQTPVADTFAGRTGQSVEAKNAIVQEALKLIKPGQTILLDAGTTGAALAASLPSNMALTIVTHSLPAASALAGKPMIEVIVLGGRLMPESVATGGAEAVAGYGRCRADLCFLGVASIDSEIGLGVFKHEDAEVKRAMLGAASTVIALASAEKLGTAAPFLIGPVSVLDQLITEASAPADQIALIRAKEVIVTIARA
jgi:DeoR/GlpR family transcriptional regulator of sugar metabolism